MTRRLVTFPDGTTVTACGIRDRQATTPDRDIGLYLDPAWEPDWEATVIPWPDFGVPADSQAAAREIRTAFEVARAGKRLEIGCLGGRGRTGTVLACMAVLAGVPPDEAVAWVRAEYDSRAVETPAQNEWVIWFAGWIEGEHDRRRS